VSNTFTDAVVDSGANAPHPHLSEVAGGVAFDFEGQESTDYVDQLGHGTAAAAAIQEKAPEAEIYVVKIFDKQLATTVPNLVKAIDWASSRGVRIVNLSLGTLHEFRASELAPAVDRAVAAGTIIVSAHKHEDQLWYPGCTENVLGVVAATSHPRESVTVIEAEESFALRASPYPRPIPGVPPERNFNGISFAVANASGCLAAVLVDHPDVKTAGEALRLLSS